jgi:hypothetical protein
MRLVGYVVPGYLTFSKGKASVRVGTHNQRFIRLNSGKYSGELSKGSELSVEMGKPCAVGHLTLLSLD